MEVYGLQQLARPRGKSDTQLCQKAMGGVKFATGVVKSATGVVKSVTIVVKFAMAIRQLGCYWKNQEGGQVRHGNSVTWLPVQKSGSHGSGQVRHGNSVTWLLVTNQEGTVVVKFAMGIR